MPSQEFVRIRRRHVGDRGTLNGDVARLWCNGRQHATCTVVPPCRRAGKPTSAVGLRGLPFPEADDHPPPNGKQPGVPFDADRDLRKDMLSRGDPSVTRRHQIFCMKQINWHHLRGFPSGGAPVRWTC